MGVIRQVAARAKVHWFLIWSSSNVCVEEYVTFVVAEQAWTIGNVFLFRFGKVTSQQCVWWL